MKWGDLRDVDSARQRLRQRQIAPRLVFFEGEIALVQNYNRRVTVYRLVLMCNYGVSVTATIFKPRLSNVKTRLINTWITHTRLDRA
jgi:hypothetical protein